MKIFIIEDDAAIRRELACLLEKYGYEVVWSDDFQNIVDHVLAAQPDLVLLDVNLPYQDGFVVCRRLRQATTAPEQGYEGGPLSIIMLTSRDSDFDELLGLETGADDYVSKPYNAQVLLARMQKLLARRHSSVVPQRLHYGGLTLDLMTATARHDGQEIALTKNEFIILHLLMQNGGSIIPRDAIIEALWQNESFIDDNTLNVNIVRLRKKLAEIGLNDYLRTRRGMGYMAIDKDGADGA